jgi:hypothetical protein
MLAVAAEGRLPALVCGAAFAIGLLLAGAGHASAAGGDPDPFARSTVGLEFGAGLMAEAWNVNDGREWLVDGTASAWWAFATGMAVVVEFHNARVFQDTGDAFVQGLSPLFRWRMRERGSWRLYAELGPGISWSDRTVPPRGTRFNYLFQGTFGIQRRVGANSHLVTGFRFLHLSNNGREGRDNNPDIEAFGAHAAVMVTF